MRAGLQELPHALREPGRLVDLLAGVPLRPRTKALAVFFAVNSILLNVVLALLPWTPEGKTVFNYTARAVIGRARSDSWGQMRVALEEFRAHPEAPLYSGVFFRRHIRFPYAPPSLLLTSVVERLPANEFAVLNFLSWLALVATVLITAALFRRGTAREDRAAAPGRLDRVVTALLVAGFTLTFYPVVKGFTLGQIQTWINLSLAGALLAWTAGGEARGGVLAALPCLVKPQYGILLLWGLTRRHWRFCAAFAAVLVGALALSTATFGWANHGSYLWMLSYVSLHGESYFANQSVNGLLQRALFNGENLTWHEEAYPPFSPGVYAGTLLAALTVIGCCLFWRPRASRRASATDLMIAILTCVLASPVAWEHHYGILLPIYALLFPVLWRRPVLGRGTLAWLAASYLLTSNYFGITQLAAGTRANPVQCYLLLGAMMVLVGLYRLRGREQMDEEQSS